MKSKFKYILLLFIFSLSFSIVSCNSDIPTINDNDKNNKDDNKEKDDKSDEENKENNKTFEELFNELKSSNISFETTYTAVYSDKDNLDPEYNPYSKVITRFSEKSYDLDATILSSNEKISFSYIKDDEGYTSEEYISLNNEAVSKKVLTSDNKPFLFEDSIYINLFSLFDHTDFIKVSDTEYGIKDNSSDTFKRDLSYLASSLSGMSSFSLKDFKIYLNDNSINTIYFESEKDDNIVENKSFYTILEAKILDINKNTYTKKEVFKTKEENSYLKEAFNELKNSSGFKTISSLDEVTLDEDTLEVSLTGYTLNEINSIYTKDDLVIDDNYSISGYHSYTLEGEKRVGSFSYDSSSSTFNENSVYKDEDIIEILDLFNLSSDVFSLVKEEGDKRTYSLNLNLESEAISKISFDPYSSYFNSIISPLRVVTINNSLDSISYGVYNNDGTTFIVNTKYKDVNNTSLDRDYFNNYVKLTYFNSYTYNETGNVIYTDSLSQDTLKNYCNSFNEVEYYYQYTCSYSMNRLNLKIYINLDGFDTAVNKPSKDYNININLNDSLYKLTEQLTNEGISYTYIEE